MNEDPTKELPQNRGFEEQVLAELVALGGGIAGISRELPEIRSEFAEVRTVFAVLRAEFIEQRTVFAELRTVFDELRTVLDELRIEFGELRTEFGELRIKFGELHTEFAELRTEFRREIAEVRTQQSVMAKNIAAIDARLTSLEEVVDARLKETRPIWEAVRAQIEKLSEKFDIVIRDLYDVRGDLALHAKRISQLEHALSS
jgi:chromosome segregation ATPase